jgi:hypothetical protein
MAPRYAKVHEIADRFRVSADAVYLWIRQGKIPSDCVVRIAGTVRVDEDQFEQRLRSGGLCQPRGRKPSSAVAVERQRPVAGEDSFTTTGNGPATEHRWISESGSVEPEHPFNPTMLTTAR